RRWVSRSCRETAAAADALVRPCGTQRCRPQGNFRVPEIDEADSECGTGADTAEDAVDSRPPAASEPASLDSRFDAPGLGMNYFQSYQREPGFLPSVALMVVVYVLLRSMRNSMWGVALLALPGTIAHEFMHLIVGFVLGAKPRGFSVWPKPRGRAWELGSVSFHNVGLL